MSGTDKNSVGEGNLSVPPVSLVVEWLENLFIVIAVVPTLAAIALICLLRTR